MNKFNILAGLVGILTVFTGYLFLSNQVDDVISVGTELPDAPALFESSLAAPITATADSFTLTANSVRGGGSLSGYNCFTIDEGSAQAEFVCGTASSTSVTGVTRGISPSDGTSAVSALQFAHRRGASVKITDFPIIQILRNQNNGEATFENALRYAGSVTPSSADELADVGYVLSVVNGGTVNFDALVVAGTAGETLATSTLVYFKSSDQRWWKVDTDDTATFTGVALGLTRGTGTSGTSIVGGGVLLKGLQTGLTGLTAGSTYYASTTGGGLGTATTVLPVGVAKSTTELYFDPAMLGVPRLAFDNTFTGNNTFSGTTTFSGNTVGFGTASVTVITTVGTSTYTKAPNVKYIVVELLGGGGGGGGGSSGSGVGGGGGAGAGIKKLILASALSATTTVTIGAGGAGAGVGGTGVTGSTSSFGTYSALGGGGGVGGLGSNNGASGGGGSATGGDYNFNGGAGSGQSGGSISAALGVLSKGNGGSGGAASGSGSAGQAGNVIITEYF